MIFDGLSVFRRSATVPICVATLLGAGCAGSPLGFKNRATALTDQPTSGAVAQADATQSGVVTLDTIANGPKVTKELQQTAGAKPSGLPNFADIFETPAKTNQQPDPFAAAESAKPPVTAQALSAPSDSRTKISASFDDTMAQLARAGGDAAKGTKSAATPFSDNNPFEPFADSAAAIAKTPKPTVTIPEGPTAKELEALLAKELAQATPATKPPAATIAAKPASNNPFADFVASAEAPAKERRKQVANDAAAYVTLDSLGSKKPATAPEATEPSIDWIKEQAAGLPAPSSPLAEQANENDPFFAQPADVAAEVASPSKTRVKQLLDSSERALRAGRYGDAETIAGQAFDLAESDSVDFKIGERTPSALLRRIASSRRSAAKAASPELDFLTGPATDFAAEQTAEVVPQKAKDAFGSFATVTTWQPVSDDGVEYNKPTSVDSVEAADGSKLAFTWQASNGSRAGHDFKAHTSTIPAGQASQAGSNESVFQTASLTRPEHGTPDPRWSPKANDEPQSEISQTSAIATSLAAPQLNASSSTADQAPWAQTSFEPQFGTNEPSLPELPKLGDTDSSAVGNFESDLWGDEETQVAMATMEVAPPAPMMLEAGDGSAEEPLNYGTLLALLTVIGLGLVAVLAFRTQPESLDA